MAQDHVSIAESSLLIEGFLSTMELHAALRVPHVQFAPLVAAFALTLSTAFISPRSAGPSGGAANAGAAVATATAPTKPNNEDATVTLRDFLTDPPPQLALFQPSACSYECSWSKLRHDSCKRPRSARKKVRVELSPQRVCSFTVPGFWAPFGTPITRVRYACTVALYRTGAPFTIH